MPNEAREVPLDIALSLLRPDELEKLQKYVVSYLAMQNREEKVEKHNQREAPSEHSH
jgi:hypothetical protein